MIASGEGASYRQYERRRSADRNENSQRTPSSALIVLDQPYVLPGQLELSANVRSIRNSAIVSTRSDFGQPRTQTAGVRVACRLGAVRATGLAEDAANVVRRRVLADVQRAPDIAVRQPCATRRRTPARAASGRRAAARPASAPAPASGRGRAPPQADALRQVRRLASSAARPSGSADGPARLSTARTVGAVGQPGRPRPSSGRTQRAVEVVLGRREVAERRREHPQVAVGRPVAGDAVADHDVRPRKGRARCTRSPASRASPTRGEASAR